MSYVYVLPCLLAITITNAFGQTACGQLRSLELPATTVTLAEFVGAGPLQLPGMPPQATAPMLPAHCRLAATLKPSADSEIKIEVWLPLESHWNRKLLAVGGAGFVGAINYDGLAFALRDGYATASTDTGHETRGVAWAGSSASFAVGHPEKIVDFAYRAVHEMTVKAKVIITAHYGRAARLSYWQGCSTGGGEGLMEAQRYPEDFDGIIAGAPANNQFHLSGWRMALVTSVLKDPARAVPSTKTALLNKAVLDACDALDGVKDGLLADPRQCQFDPATLLCRSSDQENCLTAAQLETVKLAYADARTKSGELIYPGLVPGGETGWALSLPDNKEPWSIDLGAFRFVAHQDPHWDWRIFDLERDLALAEQRAGYMESTNRFCPSW